MAVRERVKRTSNKSTATIEDVPVSGSNKVDTESVKADLDSLLDEIDGVLEENAAEFVQNYVQKGGE